MKTKQKLFVLNQLSKEGQISRNLCLRNFISRLGSIMCQFKYDGLKFDAKFVRGDYVYTLKKRQKRLLKNLFRIYQ